MEPIKLAYVTERDVDFVLMREMNQSDKVRELFFDLIGLKGRLVKTYHSLTQEEAPGKYGESDLVFIFECDGGNRFAIFVEDKVTADAQPEQRERYDVRANLLKKTESFDKHFVVLCAPKEYIDREQSKKKYSLRISHNQLIELCVDEIDKIVLEESCKTKARNTTVKNENVTNFWNCLIDYINENHDNLIFSRVKRDRGGSALWPEFGTNVKGLMICYKSNQNVIDFEFSQMANKRDTVIEIFDKLNVDISDYHFYDSKSGGLMLSYDLPNDKSVDFNKPFDNQKENIKFILNKVTEMVGIAYRIGDSGYSSFPIK